METTAPTVQKMENGDLCLVTGASGYIASWIAKDLLDQGFRVRGTVRSLSDTDKVTTLRMLLPEVELVAADLRSPDGWAEAVAGVKWVFHVASPQAVPSEKDRTGGAVRGTEHLLKAALKSLTVMKVVLTSSEAAVAYGFPPSKQFFTEDDWTVLDGPAGKSDYFRSKTLAERLAWDMIANPSLNPRGVRLSTINPGFVAGPSLVPWGRFSLKMVQDMATGKMAALPDMVTHVVDVRDCAAMHIAVMNDPATDGHRHLSFGMVGKMTAITDIIRKNFSDKGFSPRPKVAPTWMLGVVRFVSPQVGSIYSKLSQPNVYKTKWPGVYNYGHTDLEETINASMASMIAHGWLKPKVTRPAGPRVSVTSND